MKLIGIDYGRRRIGCAITDDAGMHIRGLTTIDRKKHPQTLPPLMEIIARERPRGIVVGLPLDCNEGETRMSTEARAFAENLRERIGLPVYYIDESLSSKEATSLLRFRKKKDRRSKGAVDRIAACIILENFVKENSMDVTPLPPNRREVIDAMATLYLVSTPIGNLEDITARATKVLARISVILAEDRRVSRTLLQHLGIGTIPETYHDFNKERVTPRLIARLKNGEDMALITDAGTPGIADPAYNLVRAAIDAGISIVPIPGPAACIAALSASGLPTDRFVFENFMPNKGAARRKVLSTFSEERRTVIFYETPHRIVKVLEDIEAIFGEILVVIAREMTKVYEEFLRGTPRELLEHFTAKPPRGEMVVLFNPRVRCDAQKEKTPAGGKLPAGEVLKSFKP